MRLPASLPFRLALVYVLLFAGSTAFLAGVTYLIVIKRPFIEAQELVRREADDLADTYVVEGQQALVARLEARERHSDPRKAFHLFIAPGGKVVTTNLPSWPQPSNGWLRVEADLYADGEEDDHEALSLDHVFEDGARLLVGRDIEDITDSELSLRQAASWIIGVATLLGLGGGALIGRVISRRLDVVASAARRVIGGDLSGRVPTRGTGDDFDQLSATLNHMLDRIEELMESVRRVSDNVAHELRTPLSRLRGNLEALAQSGASGETGLLEDTIGEAGRLEAIFDAVLRIARIESGRHAVEAGPVDLSTLLADAAELYQPAAEDRGQHLHVDVEPGLTVAGDRDLIFQAICNLLDNAIKYGPVGGEVALSARRGPAGIEITVADDGPGIAEEERRRVTERFYRAPATADTPGYGLGLSLVAAVAERHRSALSFLDGNPGLLVRWIFRD